MLVYFLFFTFLSALLHSKARLLQKTEKNLILLTRVTMESGHRQPGSVEKRLQRTEEYTAAQVLGLRQSCACVAHIRRSRRDRELNESRPSPGSRALHANARPQTTPKALKMSLCWSHCPQNEKNRSIM